MKRGVARNERSYVAHLVIVAVLIAVSALPSRTQDYPVRPIRILMPFAPGGVADIAARHVKERFAAGGVATIPSSPAELDARIKRELSGYRTIVEKADIHVD
jgi:tripartite-type tricarboxylate transporter receptor subunit TctC